MSSEIKIVEKMFCNACMKSIAMEKRIYHIRTQHLNDNDLIQVYFTEDSVSRIESITN